MASTTMATAAPAGIDEAIATLHPSVAERARAHVKALAADGFETVRVIGVETLDEREALWSRGRKLMATGWTIADPSRVVTHSPITWHPFGFAYDLVLLIGGRQPSAGHWPRIWRPAADLGLLAPGKNGLQRWACTNHFQRPPAGMDPRDARVIFERTGSIELFWRYVGRSIRKGA